MAIDAISIVAEAREWIGTPYVHQASAKQAGCDCLGLLRGVWRGLVGDEPETPPAYSSDWAEASGFETLYHGMARHFTEIGRDSIGPGDVALFRMKPGGPAKHCAIVAERGKTLTIIHARQARRVSEEPLTRFWRTRLVFAFRV